MTLLRPLLRPVLREPLRSPFVRRGGFSPASLFSAGEQGGWYDPSDFSTMFQDSAGTTPVTAVGQPVGKINDKSGRGNHLIQATAASRPVLSARYNKLTKTEKFDDAAWIATACSVVPNAAVAPDGTTTADKIVPSTGANGESVVIQAPASVAASHTITCYMKQGEFRYGTIRNLTGASFVIYDLQTGAVSFNNDAVNVTASISSVGNGWYRASFTQTVASLNVRIGATNTSNSISVTGDGSSGIYAWGADARLIADASLSIPAYQRVDTATSYDTAGFPAYLEFDGVDDGLASAATVNFTASQQLTFFAGITKTASSGLGALCELSALPTAAGSFSIQAPASSEDFGFYAVGTTTSVSRVATPFAAPSSKVLSCLFNTAGGAGANISPRINATVPTLTADANLGAAVFQNATLYVGRRGGTTFPFIGRLYQLVIRGATSDATAIANTERFVGSKMGIAL